MAEQLATYQVDTSAIESVIAKGDLAKLTPPERVNYYNNVCRSLGLNPLTQPFQYIQLNGKLTLYARRDAAEQLRKRDNISVTIQSREMLEGVYVVTARATAPDGRQDESIGAVSVTGLKGDALANAMMKAETKSKRRVTLSIVGLGWLDETEIETIPTRQEVAVDTATGEIVDSEPAQQPQPKPTNGGQQVQTGGRPWTVEQVVDRLQVLMSTHKGKLEPSDKQVKFALSSLQKLTGNNDDARHIITRYLFGVDSTGDLTGAQCSAVIDWIGANADNDWQPLDVAVEEARRVYAAGVAQDGQQAMFEDDGELPY